MVHEARGLFEALGLLLLMVQEETEVADARADAWEVPPRHMGDKLERLFFKNTRFELIALRS